MGQYSNFVGSQRNALKSLILKALSLPKKLSSHTGEQAFMRYHNHRQTLFQRSSETAGNRRTCPLSWRWWKDRRTEDETHVWPC